LKRPQKKAAFVSSDSSVDMTRLFEHLDACIQTCEGYSFEKIHAAKVAGWGIMMREIHAKNNPSHIQDALAICHQTSAIEFFRMNSLTQIAFLDFFKQACQAAMKHPQINTQPFIARLALLTTQYQGEQNKSLRRARTGARVSFSCARLTSADAPSLESGHEPVSSALMA
jgi:hypothetical protein